MIENDDPPNTLKNAFKKWPDIDNNELFSFYSEIKLNKVINCFY